MLRRVGKGKLRENNSWEVKVELFLIHAFVRMCVLVYPHHTRIISVSVSSTGGQCCIEIILRPNVTVGVSEAF